MHYDENLWVIYGLRLKDSSECRYVGLTRVGAGVRFSQHLSHASAHKTYSAKWVHKNRENLRVTVLEVCPIGDTEYLYFAERYWISEMKSLGHRLTNQSDGGASGCYGARWTLSPEQIRSGEEHPNYGKPVAESTKELLRRANSGKVRSNESRRMQSESISGDKHWAYGGGKFTDEHKKKISEALTGKKLSPERIAQMSLSRKGKPKSEEFKRNLSVRMSGSSNPNYGKPAHNKGKPNPSAHIRWHVNRGVTSPDTCNYCKETIEQGSN